ncbi:MAG: restriction endonuclease [bacterium]|nr:restriction endonuclease [bacterium]
MDVAVARAYRSRSQQSRVVTESWLASNGYCLKCGNHSLEKFENNRPVADFYCAKCNHEYELKSKRGGIGKAIADGEYHKKIERLNSLTNPSLFVLGYNDQSYMATDLLVVPSYFFTDDLIEKRKPLSSTARRAGWIGSNILLSELPQSGRVFLIRNGVVRSKSSVLAEWSQSEFLAQKRNLEQRGWLIDIMKCVDRIRSDHFALADVYAFENELAAKHPGNKFIRDKIRQQLQVLRDMNYLEFLDRGHYRKKQPKPPPAASAADAPFPSSPGRPQRPPGFVFVRL